MNRLLRAAALLMACSCTSAFQISSVCAQAPAAASNDSNAPIKLPSGLDKDLIDSSGDPCTNFVQYACGNFTKLYPTPADQPGYDDLIMIEEHTQSVLHQLLDSVADKSAQHTPNEQKIGDYYATCLDERRSTTRVSNLFSPSSTGSPR